MNQLRLLTDDEWRAAIAAKGEAVYIERSDDDVRSLLRRENSQFFFSIESLARRNDVATLEQILRVGAAQWGSRSYEPGERGKICYATAHMLIDGGGNEEFAHRWMATIGHSQALAREHIFSVFLNNSMLPTVEIFKQTSTDIQNWLGVLTLAGEIFKTQHDGNLFLKAGESASELPDTDSRRGYRTRLAAEILRQHSPEELPQLGMRDSLAELAWLNAFKGSMYLPSIKMAYGTSNNRVREQLQQGLKKVLKEERFEVCTGLLSQDRWNGILTWGNADTAKALFNAVVLHETGDKPVMGSKPLQKMSFTDGCKRVSETMFSHIAEVLEAIGHDQNEASPDYFNSKGCRLIDVAAQNYNAKVFNHLVANGADPTEPVRPSMMSPATHVRLAMKKQDRLTEGVLRSVTQMDDMLKAWTARNAAELALKELDLGMTP